MSSAGSFHWQQEIHSWAAPEVWTADEELLWHWVNQLSAHQEQHCNTESKQITHKWVSNYRFGPFLKITEHALDVFEVGGKRSIMKGKIPLPGCAALSHTHTQKKTLDCHTTQKQVKYIFNYFKKKSSILKDLQSKSFLRRLPLARHTYTVNGRPWYTIKFTAQLTLRRAFRPDSLRESQKGFNKRHTHSWKHQNLWI